MSDALTERKDSHIACSLGTGTHRKNYELSEGSALRVSAKKAFNTVES